MAESNEQVQNGHTRELPLLHEAGFPTGCQAGTKSHQDWMNAINELLYKPETDSQILKTNLW